MSDTPQLLDAQPIRKRVSTTGSGVIEDRDARTFDQTYLSERTHGRWIHRDYAAHFFRWGFAAMQLGHVPLVRGRAGNAGVGGVGGRVLDVGCGPETPFLKTLVGTPTASYRPETYVGVDLNALRESGSHGVTLLGGFNFVERWRELEQFAPFDLAVCYEVVEHMPPDAASALMRGVRALLAPSGRFLLSTPVFDGARARNHVHEFTVPELQALVEAAGFSVVQRYGTFASLPTIKKACTADERALLDRLGAYYRADVLACFLAPLYPDASRNNLWVLRRDDDVSTIDPENRPNFVAQQASIALDSVDTTTPPTPPADVSVVEPAQTSVLPTSETYAGPTALARVLIAEGRSDTEIMAATRQAFGKGSPRPLKFTTGDLKRLRERVARKENSGASS